MFYYNTNEETGKFAMTPGTNIEGVNFTNFYADGSFDAEGIEPTSVFTEINIVVLYKDLNFNLNVDSYKGFLNYEKTIVITKSPLNSFNQGTIYMASYFIDGTEFVLKPDHINEHNQLVFKGLE
jgi:hypothetical protein